MAVSLARLVLVILFVVWLFGIAGLTCFFCFPRHYLAWAMFGLSSFLGACSIFSIYYAAFLRPLKWRWALIVGAIVVISGLLVTGLYIHLQLPSIDPPERSYFLIMTSLVPVTLISFSLAPGLLRIHRGIHLSQGRVGQFPEQHRRFEYLSLAATIATAFLLPIGAEWMYGDETNNLHFLLLYGVACVVASSFVFWPIALLLMKCSWKWFGLVTTVGILSSWIAIACYQTITRTRTLMFDEIVRVPAAILSGPIMILLFLMSIRLLEYRLTVPTREFGKTEMNLKPDVHPLDVI